MCDVYYNCEFCLAAPGSASHGSGLYSIGSVPTERFSSSSCGLRSLDNEVWDIYGREPLSSSHHLLKDPDTITMQDAERSPGTLRFRGWVYQERMLAPRTIQFLEQELSWDCRRETACECGMMGHDVGFEASMGEKKIKFVSELQSVLPERHASRWREVVSSYTSLYLTKESDRLPAIAGVTRTFEQTRKPRSTCHAGIWSDTAAHDLSWRVFDLHSQRKIWSKERCKTRILGVPTWSWASVYASVDYYAGVDYYTKHFEPLCRVLEMGPPGLLSSLGTNQAHAQSQDLIIHGQLLPAAIVHCQDVHLEDVVGAEKNVRYTYALRFNGDKKTWRFHEDDDLRLPGADHVPHDTAVLCLALGKYQIHRTTLTHVAAQYSEQFDRYDSLVLQVVDACENKYRRIGLLNSSRVMWLQPTNTRTIYIC